MAGKCREVKNISDASCNEEITKEKSKEKKRWKQI
jgi:hypothetical protein